MRLIAAWLLPLSLASIYAASEAPVYIFGEEARISASTSPTLSLDEASLVFARRLGFSNRHSLKDATGSTLLYINSFGGKQETLFSDDTQNVASSLLVVVDGLSAATTKLVSKSWSESLPAFSISLPARFSGEQLVQDQEVPALKNRIACDLVDDINPLNEECWNGRSKALYYDLSCDNDGSKLQNLLSAQSQLMKLVDSEALNFVAVLLPELTSPVDCIAKAKTPSKASSHNHLHPRQNAEEPMIKDTASDASMFRTKQMAASNKSHSEPITGVPPRCHVSLDLCTSATNNCTGHGECYKKSGGCFACACVPQKVTFKLSGGRNGFNIINWGGAACQKKDISGPFWLIALFSVVMVGLVSWGIGLLYSVGEEKLPGVIGAGVSSKAK